MPTRTPARPLARRPLARNLAIAGAIAALPMLTTLGGCWHNEGGPGYSNDSHTYISNAWRPWTVTLVDTRTGEAVWSVDIPVDQQLSIRFRKGDGPSDELPDMMDWGLMDAGKKYGHRKNRLPVPGPDARLLKPTLRPTPEMPGAILTKAPEAPDEIIETMPHDMSDESPMMEEPMDDMPMHEEQHEHEEAPIDLPDGE